jgi:hypothetical protein
MLEAYVTAFTWKQMTETKTRIVFSGFVIMHQSSDRSQIRITEDEKKNIHTQSRTH